jgi:hypothetical protein
MKLPSSLAFWSGFLLLAGATGACTPIAPSIHKSVLKSGDSQRVLPAPSTSPRGDSPSQRLNSDSRESQIEVRWVRDDDSLSKELESEVDFSPRKATKDELSLLRKEGGLRIELNVGESDSKEVDLKEGNKSRAVRVVLRVQLSEERLQALLEEESWSFAWEDSSRKTLVLSTGSSKSAIGDALVSIHLISER